MTEQHMQIEGIETTTNPLFWDYFVAQHTKKMHVGQLGMNLTAVNPIQLAEKHCHAGPLYRGARIRRVLVRQYAPMGWHAWAASGCDVDGIGPLGWRCPQTGDLLRELAGREGVVDQAHHLDPG
jgi:hypothetical protein